ncbi:MAG: hypothetical protein ACI4NB_02950 [Candidatus Ornithospirochaeta sp.]
MKKNFLMVASLLIAAMLLVVSCAQEVKAPENNGLVEVRIGVGYGRDLKVEGDTKTEDVVLKYTMTQGWTNSTVENTETVYGAASNEVFEDNQPIGYVTPGLWYITVDAYEKDDDTDDTNNTKKIFTGTASAYFSDQNNSVTVYLAPVTTSNNKIQFDIDMQDLLGSSVDASGNGSYKLTYSIYGTGTTPITIGDTVQSNIEIDTKTPNSTTHVTNYKRLVSGLNSGFYRVTVSVYSCYTTNEEGQSVDHEDLIGGITKGMLLTNNQTATVKGHIEPSDYEKVTIDALYIDVETEVKVEGPVYKAAVPATENSEGSVAKASVVFKVEDSTDSSTKGGATPSYIWSVVNDGRVVTSNQNSLTVDFTAPGWKTVSCQTIYKVTYKNVDYYFADTASTQVYIDPDNNIWK